MKPSKPETGKKFELVATCLLRQKISRRFGKRHSNANERNVAFQSCLLHVDVFSMLCASM